MNSLLLIFVTFIAHVCCEAVQEEPLSHFVDYEVEGYYWREYYGYIPHDAVPGGLDEHDRPTYIGQTLHKSFIIPGEILPFEREMNYPWGYKPYTSNKNIKILCSNHLEQLEWNPTDNEAVKQLTNKHLILGGYEGGVGENYIGRKTINGTTVVGKVLINDKSYAGLHVNRNDKALQFHSFEILIFNPYIPAKKQTDKSVIAIGERGDIEYGLAKQGCPKNIIHLNFNPKKLE